nr:MgtC/SapB family protein [Paenibacillus turpanensis]
MDQSLAIWQVDEVTIAIRVMIALLLGGLIGLEREYSQHAAGFRTHILVCVGSATIMLLSIYGFSDFVAEENVRVDPARLATAVISGIGFLGAGTIMQQGTLVTGLTTAASLWVVAAIGLSVGAGFYFAAFLTTAVVIISLWMLSKVEHRLISGGRVKKLTLRLGDRAGTVADVSAILQAANAEILRMSVGQSERSGLSVSITIRLRKTAELPLLLEQVRSLPGVEEVLWDGDLAKS